MVRTVCTSRLPSVLPLPQPLTLSHILGKARLTEVFKDFGKWSGEEHAPLTKEVILQPVSNMTTGRVYDVVQNYSCHVRQNGPFQLGYIRVNLDKSAATVFSFTG